MSDEILRALARRYEADPEDTRNASLYIRALERSMKEIPDSSLLLDIWGSLVVGLFDREGISRAVFESLKDLTEILFGEEASAELLRVTAATWEESEQPDDRYNVYNIDAGWGPSWFDAYLKKIGYICQHEAAFGPESKCSQSIPHKRCEIVVGSGERCPCPGCYASFSILMNRNVWFCWHHFQISESAPRIQFPLDISRSF